jgi:hypothetical protein
LATCLTNGLFSLAISNRTNISATKHKETTVGLDFEQHQAAESWWQTWLSSDTPHYPCGTSCKVSFGEANMEEWNLLVDLQSFV